MLVDETFCGSADCTKDYADFILEFRVDPDPNIPLDPRLSAAVVALWKDPCIPKVMEHQNEFYLMDSAP